MIEKVKQAIKLGDPLEVAWYLGARMALEYVKPKWTDERRQLAAAAVRVMDTDTVQEMVEDFLQFVAKRQAEITGLEKMLGTEEQAG